MLQVGVGVDAFRTVVVTERRASDVQLVKVAGFASTQGAESALQRVFERFSEVAVEVGVDERIQRRIEVADPEEDGYDVVGTVACVAAQRGDHVPVGEGGRWERVNRRKRFYCSRSLQSSVFRCLLKTTYSILSFPWPTTYPIRRNLSQQLKQSVLFLALNLSISVQSLTNDLHN